jgi:thioredoxin-related protein
LRLGAKDTVHGAVCQILELEEHGAGGLLQEKLWIDANHGFLPRRFQFVVSSPDGQKSLTHELDVLKVLEVLPGVWAPAELRCELFPADKKGFHTVRHIMFESIDIAKPVPDESFVLQAPSHYYVHDYILNKHRQPDLLKKADERSAGRKREPIYNEKVDAKADITRALHKAAGENKRVLIVYGGNWCSWCYRLHDLFEQDSEIRSLLEAQYEVVLVDINTNGDIARKYQVGKNVGYPYLTVLDADGKVIKNQNTGDLEKGPKHDRGKVLAFLREWQVKGLRRAN